MAIGLNRKIVREVPDRDPVHNQPLIIILEPGDRFLTIKTPGRGGDAFRVRYQTIFGEAYRARARELQAAKLRGVSRKYRGAIA